MRDRKVNHGRDTSPTLEAWADRLEASIELTVRDQFTLAMMQALGAPHRGETAAEYAERVCKLADAMMWERAKWQ